MQKTAVKKNDNRTITEYAGYVKNVHNDKYERLFITEISAPLAKARAVEKAQTANSLTNEDCYDVLDACVKKRTVTMIYGEWEDMGEEA